MARLPAVSQPDEVVGSKRNVAFAALRHRPFRIYLPAAMLAMTGDNMEHVISYWAMYQEFHSPLLAGYAVISHWLPVLLFGLYAGALADRFDCRRLIQISTAINTTAQIGWGVLLITDQLEPWHAVVLLTLHGLAALFHGPATQLVMHDMVGREDLQSAVRLSATSRQLGVLLGPGIGGALMLAVGPGVALLINATTQLPLALWLLVAPYTGHLREPAGGSERRSMAPRDVVGTVRQLWSNRSIAVMLVVAGLSAVLVGNAFQAQMPEFAEDLGDPDGGHGYTALQMAQAAGALLGGIGLEATSPPARFLRAVRPPPVPSARPCTHGHHRGPPGLRRTPASAPETHSRRGPRIGRRPRALPRSTGCSTTGERCRQRHAAPCSVARCLPRAPASVPCRAQPGATKPAATGSWR